MIHQDALIDIAEKVQKFVEQVSKNAKNLMAGPETLEQTGDKLNNSTENQNSGPMSPKPKLQRAVSRQGLIFYIIL